MDKTAKFTTSCYIQTPEEETIGFVCPSEATLWVFVRLIFELFVFIG